MPVGEKNVCKKYRSGHFHVCMSWKVRLRMLFSSEFPEQGAVMSCAPQMTLINNSVVTTEASPVGGQRLTNAALQECSHCSQT